MSTYNKLVLCQVLMYFSVLVVRSSIDGDRY